MLLPRHTSFFFSVFIKLTQGVLQLTDFLRFGVKYVEELYAQQPPKNAAGAWK